MGRRGRRGTHALAVTKVLVRDEAPGQQPTGYPWAVACAPCAGHHGHMGGLEGDTQAGLRLCPTCAWVSSCPGHSRQPHRTGGGGAVPGGSGLQLQLPSILRSSAPSGSLWHGAGPAAAGTGHPTPASLPPDFFPSVWTAGMGALEARRGLGVSQEPSLQCPRVSVTEVLQGPGPDSDWGPAPRMCLRQWAVLQSLPGTPRSHCTPFPAGEAPWRWACYHPGLHSLPCGLDTWTACPARTAAQEPEGAQEPAWRRPPWLTTTGAS